MRSNDRNYCEKKNLENESSKGREWWNENRNCKDSRKIYKENRVEVYWYNIIKPFERVFIWSLRDTLSILLNRIRSTNIPLFAFSFESAPEYTHNLRLEEIVEGAKDRKHNPKQQNEIVVEVGCVGGKSIVKVGIADQSDEVEHCYVEKSLT